MKPWHGMAAALLAVVAGCGPAAAQERAHWEHGVLEWVRYRSATEDQERYSWATAPKEIQRESASGLFDALGLEADRLDSVADRLRILDHLSEAGWELVNSTDVAHTDARGSATVERYILRRRRG